MVKADGRVLLLHDLSRARTSSIQIEAMRPTADAFPSGSEGLRLAYR